MRLLYVYMEFHAPNGEPSLHRGLTHFEINFGTKEFFKYSNERLEASDVEVPLPESFWGENIYNVTTLAGDNGSGKSTIINCIIGVLWEVYKGEIKDFNKTILVLEEKGKLTVLFMPGKESDQLEITERNMELYTILPYGEFPRSRVSEAILKTKLIYLTNTINEEDFRRAQSEETRENQPSGNRSVHVRNRFLYDCSTCGLMVSDYRNDVNWKRYQDGYGDKWLEIFFAYEKYKQVKYVFDKKQYAILERLRKQGYHVPVPKKLTITVYPADFSIVFSSKGSLAENDRGAREKSLLFPKADLQIKKWKEQLESQKMKDISVISMEVLVYELCCNCVLGLFRSIMLVLGDAQRDEFIEYFRHFMRNQTSETIKGGIDKEEFTDLIDKMLETYRVMSGEGQEEENRENDFQWLGECSRDFVQFLFREKGELANHFQIEKPVEYYLIPPLPHSSPIIFSITIKNAEWFSEFLQKYRYTCNPYYFLEFNWGLSSGEDNLLRLFTSLYYIFEKDYANERNGQCKICNIGTEGNQTVCESVILFFDEADLTYHPEWQRRFVSILTAFLQKIYPKECCREIQVVLSTHSPLLLGDMPSHNVVYLKKDKTTGITQADGSGSIGTFGQNIHLILRDSFFLQKGTIGEFAGKKIQYVVDGFEEIRRFLKDWQTEESQPDFSKAESYISKIKGEFEPIISLLAEGIIKGKLMDLASEYTRQLEKLMEPKQQYIDFPIRETKQQYADFSSRELEEKMERISQELARRERAKKND